MDWYVAYLAIQNDDLNQLQQLLNLSGGGGGGGQLDPNLDDEDGEPLIHTALADNSKRIVRWLVKQAGIDLTVASVINHNTPLMAAALYGISHDDYSNFWCLLSQTTVVATLSWFNANDSDVVEILLRGQQLDLVKYLYRHHPDKMNPVHNLLEAIKYPLITEEPPYHYQAINFLCQQVMANASRLVGDGKLLLQLSKIKLETGELVDYKLRVFKLVLEQTDDVNVRDDETGYSAANYCCRNNNITCLKRLLLTGKMTDGLKQLICRTPLGTRRLLINYFRSPVEYSARWSKELDSDRGPAADLFVLQSCWLKPGSLIDCQSACHQESVNSQLSAADDNDNDNDNRVVRFFSILDRINEDTAKIVCLKTCDTTSQHTYIPDSYIRIAQADLANDDH